MYLEHLKNTFENKPCYIVGKGFSLNNVTRACFLLPDAPVIVISEAIRIIEKLKLPNKLISLQKDAFTVINISWETQLLLHVHESAVEVGCLDKELFDNVELGLEINDFSALTAIRIGQLMGCNEFHFVSFDSVTKHDYRSLDGKLPPWVENYKIQARKMKQFVKPIKHSWITP